MTKIDELLGNARMESKPEGQQWVDEQTSRDARRHRELVEQLEAAREAYHLHGESELSDDEYDAMSREVAALEQKHGELESEVNAVVGAQEQRLGELVRRHPSPVQSLDNAFSDEDLAEFGERLARKLGHGLEGIEFTVEHKYDGLSANLVYQGGRFDHAETRGDGLEGADISAQMRLMGIPEVLRGAGAGTVEIRGEIYMPRSVLAEHNRLVEAGDPSKAGMRAFANCRNAAVGSLRKGTPERVALLRFVVWGAGLTEGISPTSQSELLEWVAAQGFETDQHARRVSSLAEAAEHHHDLQATLMNRDFDADGSVIKVNRFDLQLEAGKNSRAPAWAIAWKFKAQQVTTPLRSVTFTTGSQGKITPVAELEPVQLEGSVVARATLNNADYLAQLGVHEGDTLIVQKAGGVIPQIVGVVASLRPAGARPVTIPDSCPACGAPAVREEGQAGTFCVNPDCPAQSEARLLQAVGADVLDIQGMGETVVAALHAAGITHFAQLYTLDEDTLAGLQVSAGQEADRTPKRRALGKAVARKVMGEIDASRTTDLWRFIRAMNIPMTGKGTSTRLARVYSSLEELRDAAVGPEGEKALAEIRDIGKLTAASIARFFREHRDLPERLRASGVDPRPSEQLQQGGALAGMSIVVTGSMSQGRSEVEDWLRRQGADVTGSVSKKTTHLLAGPGGGGKLAKAQQLGTAILSEEEMSNLAADRGLSWLQAPAAGSPAQEAAPGTSTTQPAAQPETQASSGSADPASMKVVVTGTLSRGRNEVQGWLAQQGASVQDAIRKDTTHLIAGAGAGSKLDKARAAGITVWSEEEARDAFSGMGRTWLA